MAWQFQQLCDVTVGENFCQNKDCKIICAACDQFFVILRVGKFERREPRNSKKKKSSNSPELFVDILNHVQNNFQREYSRARQGNVDSLDGNGLDKTPIQCSYKRRLCTYG